MTAVIGILNKHGVTMAADSAVTVTGGNQKKSTILLTSYSHYRNTIQ